MAQQRDHEHQPPHAHARERQLRGGHRTREAEGSRTQNPRQVHDEQHAAAEVAERITRGRHAVGVFGLRHARQQRVVEHERARDAQVAEDEDDGRPLPAAFADRGEQEGGEDAEARKEHEQLLAPRREVAVGAEHRRGHGHDRHRHRGDEAEARGRLGGRHPGGGVAGEEGGEHRRDDGGEVGGVAAVVPRPRPLFRGDEADAGEQSGQHAPKHSAGRRGPS